MRPWPISAAATLGFGSIAIDRIRRAISAHQAGKRLEIIRSGFLAGVMLLFAALALAATLIGLHVL
jgi:hypothetical protein